MKCSSWSVGGGQASNSCSDAETLCLCRARAANRVRRLWPTWRSQGLHGLLGCVPGFLGRFSAVLHHLAAATAIETNTFFGLRARVPDPKERTDALQSLAYRKHALQPGTALQREAVQLCLELGHVLRSLWQPGRPHIHGSEAWDPWAEQRGLHQ